MTGKLGLVFVAAVVAGVAWAQDIDRLGSLRKTYDESLARADSAYRADLATRLEQYGQFVEQRLKVVQGQGELDSVLALQNELKRFQAERTVPAETPADAAPVLRQLREDHRQSLHQAELTRSRGVLDLAAKYSAALDAAKREYTVKGQFDAALAAKQEVERVMQSAQVVGASFAVGEQEARSAAPSPPAGAGDRVACPDCNGTGQGQAACGKCGGAGQCNACGGQGRRPAGLKGNRVNVACVTCKGTGRCAACNGTGNAPGVCPACRGVRLVAAPAVTTPVEALLPTAAPSVRPAAPATASAPPRTGSEASAGLKAYADSVARLRQRFAAGQAVAADFEETVRSAAQHVGELFNSSVYLVEGSPRQVLVAGTQHDAKIGGRALTTESVAVGDKAEKLSWTLKRSDKAVITYGVVNKDLLMLFDIRQE